jgi:hypothetical protein
MDLRQHVALCTAPTPARPLRRKVTGDRSSVNAFNVPLASLGDGAPILGKIATTTALALLATTEASDQARLAAERKSKCTLGDAVERRAVGICVSHAVTAVDKDENRIH